ncbi:hypothetical protein D7V86_24335 [bacterium D16-51]|nr:hypothetical protein D7V96_03660 [bacterium D16-59]RKI54031.1 hypothetical protein D7V86_24335 [bacterium D16-51]
MIFRAGLQNALALVAVMDAKHPPQLLCTITHSVQRKRTEPKYPWKSVVSSSDSCPCARICRKLKKQSNSKRAKLSCGKQCLSKFLSDCNLQKTFAFL